MITACPFGFVGMITQTCVHVDDFVVSHDIVTGSSAVLAPYCSVAAQLPPLARALLTLDVASLPPGKARECMHRAVNPEARKRPFFHACP